MSYKLVGDELNYRFASALEAGKHGVDLAIEKLRKSGAPSTRMDIEETSDPVNAIHDGAPARRLT
jgi:hypothetical protein